MESDPNRSDGVDKGKAPPKELMPPPPPRRPIPYLGSNPRFNYLPSARLISFPNADVLGKLTSDQLDVLVFQYLHERGLKRTAFQFENETEIKNTPIDRSTIDKGALPSFVHKGLRYTQLEANMHATDVSSFTECYRLEPLDIITNNVHELSKIIKNKKENAKGKRKRVHCRESDQEQGSNKRERNINVYGGPQLKARTSSLPPITHQVSDSDVYLLEGHSVEVSACAWSPTDSLLAVGSSDSMALIWKISDDLSKIYNSNPDVRYLIRPDPKSDGLDGVSTLAWNGEGELLATGSFDGLASIWTKNGELKKALDNHKDTIFFIAWNGKGDFLLTGSGSSDNRVVVWDTNRWEFMQEVAFDSEQLIGVAWRNDTSFAACSGDKRICVYNIGESQPVKTFSGYQEEVCGINWNPTGSLLASYPHDRAIKIWTLERDESLHDLMHNEIVHTVRWSPTGPGTNNPSKPYSFLASASEDRTVKVWDCVHGQLLYSFNGHRASVVELEFRPDGEYLASASEDQHLLIWNIKDGTIMQSYGSCDTSIYNLSWHKAGKLITAGSDDGTLCVVDVSF